MNQATCLKLTYWEITTAPVDGAAPSGDQVPLPAPRCSAAAPVGGGVLVSETANTTSWKTSCAVSGSRVIFGFVIWGGGREGLRGEEKGFRRWGKKGVFLGVGGRNVGIGPKEDFFHCSKCNLCLSLSLRGKHKCIENVSRQDCPICLEDIHTSRVGAHVLPCEWGIAVALCPLCMHSALDMTRYWRQLDDEVAQTPMPTEYQNMMVEILCNDCNARSTVQFHLLGMKCKNCESYNTAQDGRCRLPLEEQ
uniref:Ring finger and CHY zinc finger domain containing 1 n=1 Tax=Bubo bubo TaxID=30461 RepID=A0A8C0F9S5_BUBBB